MHYYIEDRSNKRVAQKAHGLPHWQVDSLQFNKYSDSSVIANIQQYDIKTGKETNASVLISLDDLRNAYEVLKDQEEIGEL